MAEQDLQQYFDNPTETGLLDDFDLTIEKVEFAPDGRIQNGEVTLAQVVKGTYRTTDGEIGTIGPDTDGKPMFKCGPGWQSNDGGKTVAHPDDKQKFHQNSHMGEIVEILSKSEEKGGLGLRETLVKRGFLPTDHRFLEGLTLHWKRDQRTFKADDGETKTYSKLIPVAFIGEGVDLSTGEVAPPETAAKAAATTDTPADDKAAKVAAAKAKAKAASNGGGLRSQVEKLAAEKIAAGEDFATFQDEALSLDGITDDDELLAEVVDEESGIFAKAQANA